MAAIRRLVFDVLKPHEPATIDLAGQVADSEGVSGVNATLLEIDQDVQNVKLTIEGDAIDYEAVEAVVEDSGGSVHSIDQVACGDHLVEDIPTPQD
ncbi:hypothetical protein BRD01_05430 [Halobacteriales archaeon QS_8_65_32]|jgi:hypothetical protein|nr:MAG: hypothetical protein BRD01_05430 [Halobacteriales archaeon QS_8_65_32]